MTLDTSAPATAPPARPQRRARRQDTGGASTGERTLGVFTHGFLVVWAILVAVPLLWAVLTALKTDNEIFTSPWSLPAHWQFGNFARAWTTANIGTYFVNSLIV